MFIVYSEFSPWVRTFARPAGDWSAAKIERKNLIEESQLPVKQTTIALLREKQRLPYVPIPTRLKATEFRKTEKRSSSEYSSVILNFQAN